MTAYTWRDAIPIEVECTPHGEPIAFIWNGHIHRVDMVIQQWRIDQGWWEQRLWRVYFKLSTHTGLLVVLYQDLVTEQWFLQGLYD